MQREVIVHMVFNLNKHVDVEEQLYRKLNEIGVHLVAWHLPRCAVMVSDKAEGFVKDVSFA